MMHPLKLTCLITLGGLLISQASLFLFIDEPVNRYWILTLVLPLFIPMRGFIKNRLYTFRWTGFLSLFYLCVGISELVSSPGLRNYALFTTLLSTVLFVSCIYYARYLSARKNSLPLG